MEMKRKVCGPVDLGRQDISMKIIFIRHGEPDYSLLEEAGFTNIEQVCQVLTTFVWIIRK